MKSVATFHSKDSAPGESAGTRTALCRLFAAAIVSDQFRTTLLHEPGKALANGYLGQAFPLSEEEKRMIEAIRATNLTDFAQKVNQALESR